MKRILFFLLLLVNLQLTTDNSSLSIGFGEVAAQSMKEETLDGVTISGNPYTNCNQCGKFLLRVELPYHKEHQCPKRIVQCNYCRATFQAWEQTTHICNTSGSKGGGGGQTASNNNGGNNNNNSSTPIGNSSGFKHSKFYTKDLKSKTGVKLIPNLPDRLHSQERQHECVVRAIAFMMELNGKDYQKVYPKLIRIAEKNGYDMDDYDIPEDKERKKGIPGSIITKLFKNYSNVNECENDYDTVTQLIDKGIPVAVSTKDVPPHMVTIIGYDDEHYYVAGGDKRGKAAQCLKAELNQTYIYVINN